MSLEEVVEGLSLGDLFGDLRVSNPEAHGEFQILLKNLCFWTMESIIVPLIKKTFYVTESCVHKNRIFYFRHDVWKRISSKAWRQITENMLEPLPISFDLRTSWQTLGFCHLRMIPKNCDSFRPIMNLRRPLTRGEQGGAGIRASVNSMLRNLHSVLDYYRLFHPAELMGASVMGLDDIHRKWRAFRSKVHEGIQKERPLYFLKLDVQACFDSIPHDALLAVISTILDKEQYVIQKYELSTLVNGNFKTQYKRSAFPAADARGIHALLGAGRFSSSCLIIDRVVGQKLERSKLLRQLEDHIRRNIVLINQRFYRQKIGIPQGSILSTLLCSLFYADLDRQHLLQFLEDPKSLLMRFVDDVLFVTTDFSTMAGFIEKVSSGFPDYGVSFNLEKVASNFSHPLIPASKQPDGHRFFWCGLALDTQLLHVSGDYSRFQGSRIAESLSIDRLSQAVPTFIEYIKM